MQCRPFSSWRNTSLAMIARMRRGRRRAQGRVGCLSMQGVAIGGPLSRSRRERSRRRTVTVARGAPAVRCGAWQVVRLIYFSSTER